MQISTTSLFSFLGTWAVIFRQIGEIDWNLPLPPTSPKSRPQISPFRLKNFLEDFAYSWFSNLHVARHVCPNLPDLPQVSLFPNTLQAPAIAAHESQVMSSHILFFLLEGSWFHVLFPWVLIYHRKFSWEISDICAKVKRKKIHTCEMLGKWRNAAFFQWFLGRVGRKVSSLKRRVRSHLLRADIKNCTLLWRGAFFEVQMSKNCTPLSAKHVSKSKMHKIPALWRTSGGFDVAKVSDRRAIDRLMLNCQSVS